MKVMLQLNMEDFFKTIKKSLSIEIDKKAMNTIQPEIIFKKYVPRNEKQLNKLIYLIKLFILQKWDDFDTIVILTSTIKNITETKTK